VAAASGTGNINTTVTLLPGGTVTFTAVAKVSPSATGALTNTATVWGVRNRTEATAFTDPTTGNRATLQQFMSPAQILVPRTVVFRVAFKF
jgi:hypothetical protein